MTTREVLALIPARGGSKGLPGKNVLPLGGVPLLAHSIAHARRSASVTRVVVSTDDPTIASVARRYGAEVVDRPPAIAGDAATSESALQHALDHLLETEAYDPDLVVFLQATSPIRHPDDIERALDTLDAERADTLFSSCRLEGFLWRRAGNGLESFSYDWQRRQRRQDAPEDLVENGSIYIFRPKMLRDTGNRLGGRIATYVMHPLCSLQVDGADDFRAIDGLIAAGVVPPSGAEQLEGTTPGGIAGLMAGVRLLALDFDGVLTDNRVLVDQNGREAVSCDRSDGLGLARAREAGLDIVIISTERNPVVTARATKLGIPCEQGCDDKLATLQGLAHARGLSPGEIAYVGNDVNDLACLRWCGIPIAVGDAYPEVIAAARLVTRARGGAGAVREVCDLLVDAVRAARSDAPRTEAPVMTAAGS